MTLGVAGVLALLGYAVGRDRGPLKMWTVAAERLSGDLTPPGPIKDPEIRARIDGRVVNVCEIPAVGLERRYVAASTRYRMGGGPTCRVVRRQVTHASLGAREN